MLWTKLRSFQIGNNLDAGRSAPVGVSLSFDNGDCDLLNERKSDVRKCSLNFGNSSARDDRLPVQLPLLGVGRNVDVKPTIAGLPIAIAARTRYHVVNKEAFENLSDSASTKPSFVREKSRCGEMADATDLKLRF